MPNNNIFFNYEQPNSTPRMEMLIVIDFLQKEAYDEYHAAKQKDIIDYAKKYYGIDIRRDRIAQILAHLPFWAWRLNPVMAEISGFRGPSSTAGWSRSASSRRSRWRIRGTGRDRAR